MESSGRFEKRLVYELNSKYDSIDDLDEISQDTHYYDPSTPELTRSYFIVFILAGGSFSMKHFHAHQAALLAEFYGQRMVFLADPAWTGKTYALVEYALAEESDRIAEIASTSEQDPLINMTNGDYSGLQQVILKPGDILYIPSGWYHKVHYLTPCIGTTQLIPDY